MKENPRLERARRVVGRRMFLGALGAGLSVAMAGRVARLAVAQPTAAPKRFFLFFMPHGMAPEHFDPRVMGGDRTNFALDQTNVSILGPLEPYKSYVNVYQGFQYRGDASTHTGIINCLSGFEGIDTTTPRTTVERVIARGLGVDPLILGACSHLPFGLDSNGMLFWDGSPVDPEKNPAKAADSLFGTGGGPMPPQDLDVEFRRELLGLTEAEIEDLSDELTGLTTEQSKLAQHLAAVQALKNGGGGTGQSNCSMRPTLPTVEMVRAASAGQVIDPSGGNDYFYQERNFPILLEAQLEVVAQALICNAARVVGLQPMYATCDFDFGFAGASGPHHNGLSHTGPQAASGAQYNSPITVDNFKPEPRAPFATAQKWFIEKLVDKVVSLLATTDDPAAPGTKVLDNTLIYVMSEVGDGQNHTRTSQVEYPQVPASLPLVTIGKCAGAIRSGQVVAMPLEKPELAATVNRPATDLYLTMARAMGVMDATFPGTTGPVTEVLA
jgi:hypothetical protein